MPQRLVAGSRNAQPSIGNHIAGIASYLPPSKCGQPTDSKIACPKEITSRHGKGARVGSRTRVSDSKLSIIQNLGLAGIVGSATVDNQCPKAADHSHITSYAGTRIQIMS